jgi:transcriptional regulator with XRE-family HTH domain
MADEGLNYPIPASQLKAKTGIIDKLGLGPEVLRLRKSGLTLEDIEVQLGIDKNTVSKWLTKYNNLDMDQKKAVQQRSIFGLADRLEENYAELISTLQDVIATGDNDIKVKVMSEMRQHLKFAMEIMEKLEIIKQNERFKEVVLDLLDQEAPGIKAKALRKLQEHRDAISVLRPM